MNGRSTAKVVVVVLVTLASLAQCGTPRGSSRRRSPLSRLLREDKIVAQLRLIERLLGELGERTGCPVNTSHSHFRELSALPSTEEDDIKNKLKEVKEEKVSPTGSSDCDYKELSANHTMLLPKPKMDCPVHKSDITEEEVKLILDTHNKLRSQVARGEVANGNPGPQPSAANMRQLVWNDELAQVALAWAFQCPAYHDKHKDRKLCSREYEVGQNIHYYWGNDDQSDWQRAVYDWYREVGDLPNDVVAAFRKTPQSMTGHYTQLVWGETHEVGCGVIYYKTKRKGKQFKQSKIYVCNYGPSGNVISLPLYQEGEAASQCQHGASIEHPGLCL